jgi:tRNA U34 5-methylaminomethyl-2-thiouridine-forming methyltransferase MnmC
MAKLLPKHRWITTEDGSQTLFSEEFQESCHSTTGAWSETILHYVEGCRIRSRLQDHDPFNILEVGFGLGIGFKATQESLVNSSHPWHFISLELDRDLVEWFKDQNPLMTWVDQSICQLKQGSLTLTILVGDARTTLPKFLKNNHIKFHAIYQDAFSPKKNPSLWTKEWFSLLKDAASSDVVLSTYSSSSSIRKSMLESGWVLKKGERFGPKRSSTRAELIGDSDPDILFHLDRSPVSSLIDDNIMDFKK